MAKKTSKVDAIKHKQAERTIIPTDKNYDFLQNKDREDISLDFAIDRSQSPQLIWAGKSGEETLSVDAPVIYKQENISPQMLIEGLRRAQKEEGNYELFAPDFGVLKAREKVEFYRHSHSWQNRMIFGDSLQIMSSLILREGLQGQVQCIYIDPPYGIKFSSNWQVSTRKKEVKDNYKDVTAAPETIRAFRDTWENGIHSYLDYWHDRFLVAKDLLKESGSIFVQISDVNSHRLRCLLDEIFGAENFISQISLRKKSPLGDTNFPDVLDYILWYCKDKSKMKYNKIFKEKYFGEGTPFYFVKDEHGLVKSMTREQKINQNVPANEKVFRMSVLSSVGYTKTCMFDFEFHGKNYQCGKKSWRTHKDGIERLIKADRIIAPSTVPCFVAFHEDFKVQIINNLWGDMSSESRPIYAVQTSIKPIERCLLMASDPGDLVLDPTCGSGTTAFVAEKWGRRWITCDTSRVALALARTRLMNGLYPNYKLRDKNDISQGFEYKTVPHITLKDIANNEDIDAIWDRHEHRLQPLRQKLGHEEDWQVPRTASGNATIAEYNDIRRARQAAIDASISAKAHSETLYDQPFVDTDSARVSGPFTMESLSPFQVPSDDHSTAERTATNDTRYVSALIEQLQKSGVENTKHKQNIRFERIALHSDDLAIIAAVGHYRDQQNTPKRAAICFGPQYATINDSFLKIAATEAVKGLGHDLLIVCGFSFAPDLVGKSEDYGKLKVLLAKMHPDLTDPKSPLRSRQGQSDNLFMVFGEPDIDDPKIDENGKVVLTIKGVDIFNHITNKRTDCGPEEIACWFIDTDYDGDCFFVRQAYFPGGGSKPYKQLEKAINGSISEEAWGSLRGTVSRPFDKPAKHGRIAVKVINHYGDEVTKTFLVP